MNVNPPVPQALVKSYHNSYLSQASVAALLIWDTIITYDQEIELIWRSPHCVVNYLFFIIRYLALSLSIISVIVNQGRFQRNDICRIYTYFSGVGNVLLIITMDALLIYRIFAFYERNRRVLVGLVILWLATSIPLLVFVVFCARDLPIIHTTTLAQGVIGECVVVGFPRIKYNLWISELIFHSILLTLVIAKFIKLTVASWKTLGISRICYIFTRDGFWVFIHLFVIFIASTLRFAGLPIIIPAILLVGMTGSRLILNLRSLGNKSDSDRNRYTYWIGKIRFDIMSEPVANADLRSVEL